MFGHNTIVGRKFFRESPEAAIGKLLVTSIFSTIQGEGPFAGVPAVFVRLTYCQYACHFCDTFFDSGDWMYPREVISKAVESCRGGPVPKLLVVTGGEPTLQTSALLSLLMLALDRFSDTQIETNGLLAPAVPDATTVVVSPKCAELAGAVRPYAELPVGTLTRADCLKFVMCDDPQSPYSEVPYWALAWREKTGRAIYVSPMAQYNHPPGATQRMYDARRDPDIAERTAAERISFWEPNLLDMERCQRNYEYAAKYVMRYDLQLSIQQHLFASLP